MKRSGAQTNGAWQTRAFGLALILTLVSLQQAWAAAFSQCDRAVPGCGHAVQLQVSSNSDSRPVEQQKPAVHSHSCGAMKHQQHAAGINGHSCEAPGKVGKVEDKAEVSAIYPDAPTAVDRESISVSGNGQTQNQNPCSLSCCQIQPQAETPGGTFAIQQQVVEDPGKLDQAVSDVDLFTPALNIYKPPRSRAVYLIVSAFLI